MRIRRIDLAAFGRFTDAFVDFGPRDERIHLVYGPNEAGKSTLLRAIWAFFYGNPRNCRDDYQHPASQLSIGMTLESPTGEVVRWTRRGTGAQSLRDEADRPVPAEAMQQLLSQLSEKVFKSQFAIHYEALREGSKLLYDQKGELGAALFAAASGMTSLSQVASELLGDAEAIFTPSGRKKPFNEVVTRIANLKKSLRDPSISVQRYNEVLQQQKAAADLVQSLQGRRAASNEQRERLQRIAAGIPIVVRLGELAAELARLPFTPTLSDDFGERFRTASSAAEILRAQIESGSQRLEKLQETLRELSPDPAAVELLPKLEPLTKLHGEYEKAQADRARLEVEIKQSRRKEAESRRSLTDAQAGAIAPPAHDLRHFRTQWTHYQKHALRIASLQRDADAAESQLAKLRGLSAAPSDARDLRPLKNALDAALRRAGVDEEIEKLAIQIAQLEHQTDLDLQSLAINCSAETLLSTELPSAAKIADFDRRWRNFEQQLERATQREAEARQQREEANARLEGLLAGQAAPTEEEVAQARTQRDRLWREIRAALDDPPAATSKAPLLKRLDETLAERFEEATREADRLADLLRSEAQRIAERLQLQAAIASHEAKRQAAEAERSKIEAERDALHEEWRAYAAGAPTRFRSPAELKEWQPSALRLQDDLRKLTKLRIERKQLLQTQATLLEELQSAARNVGLELTGRTLADVLPEVQQRASALEEEQNRRAAAEEQAAAAEQLLADSRRELAVAEKEASAIWAELESLLERWGCGKPESPLAVERLLPVLEELQQLDMEVREREERIAGIDRDGAKFLAELQEAARRLGKDASGDVSDLLPVVLNPLREARRQLDQFQDQEAQKTELEKSLEKERQNLTLEESKLAAIMREAGADSIQAVPLIIEYARQRAAIEAERRSLESQLDGLCDGETREAFASACRETELAAARRRIAELQEEAAELETQIEAAKDELRKHEAWLQDHRTLDKVAQEEMELQESLSELRTLVGVHVRSRLAAEVLQRAMRRYREENQGDLLKSGGEIFSRLTLGAYRGIRADVNDSGEAELFAVVDAPPYVPLSQLSDGARDQLYLALRLATLQQHFRQHPPTPFIVDDIFVMFDEERTLAALQELARLSQSTQVIVLTHHAHVLELAQSRLGEAQCAVHELVQTGPFRGASNVEQEAPVKRKTPSARKSKSSA